MDVTAQVLHDVEFREAKRGGYNTQDVDEFLERLAVAIDRHDAQMREARQRVAAAEQRAMEAERRAEESGNGSDADETLKRTLVLAQRTADAAIREAEERAARTIASAEEDAGRMLAEAHDATARAYAEAEEEARRAQYEARTRVLAELQELETGRELLRHDIEVMERLMQEQRERLRLSVRELQILIDDPSALREAPMPVLADVVLPEEQPAPPRQLVAQPLEHFVDHDEEDEWAHEDDGADAEWEAPDDADDYEPVPAPSPRSPRDQLRPDPRPMVAEARRQAEMEARQREEDAYLAELRKAMTDDEPLGPRDDPDDYGPPAGTMRSRFGRRR
jgi:DivIVA domain-containing protein